MQKIIRDCWSICATIPIWIGLRFICGFLFLSFTVLLVSSRPHAQPLYAVREGYSCLTCHVSPTGGGVRNFFGGAFGRQYLSSRFGEAGKEFTGEVSDRFRIGGDLRFPIVATEGGVGNSSFNLAQLNIHLAAHLTPYLDLVSTTNLATPREAYLLLSGLPMGGHLRVGRFPLAYGWAIPDDSAFIRGGLGFGFGNVDTGMELSLLPADSLYFGHLSVTNGNFSLAADNNLVKALTVKMGIQGGNAVKGITLFTNQTGNNELIRFGYFDSVLILKAITLFAEADYGRDRNVNTGAVTSMLAGYADASYRIGQSSQIRVAAEYFDQNRGTTGDELIRLTLAPEFYPSPLIAIEPAFKFNFETPEVSNNQLQLMLRSWF